MTDQERVSQDKYKAAHLEEIRAYQAEWRKEHADSQKEYMRKYYVENKEKLSASMRDRYLANRESVITKEKERYQTDKEARKKYVAEWGRQNPDKRKAYCKKWDAENPEKKRMSVRLRSHRARHQGCPTSPITRSFIEFLYLWQGGRCAGCFVDLNGKYHVDHMVPLVSGGSHSPDNVQILCQKCNHKKNIMEVELWAKLVLLRLCRKEQSQRNSNVHPHSRSYR